MSHLESHSWAIESTTAPVRGDVDDEKVVVDSFVVDSFVVVVVVVVVDIVDFVVDIAGSAADVVDVAALIAVAADDAFASAFVVDVDESSWVFLL